jgi:uncharacterized cupredoxin-like copper-binding protein
LKKENEMNKAICIMAAAIIAAPTWVQADGTHAKHGAPSTAVEERAYGRPGDPKKVTRTVQVGMADTMRFTPAELTVKRGETVRFVLRNVGKVEHEMVLGTMQELKEHLEMMKKHPQMEHDEPNAAHVDPGKRGTLVWQFTRPGEFYYGCLEPGHFEAGMVGKVTVQ